MEVDGSFSLKNLGVDTKNCFAMLDQSEYMDILLEELHRDSMQ